MLGSGALTATRATGTLDVGRQRTRLTEPLLKGLRRVLEYDAVRDLVLVLKEVKIVDDGSQLGLLRCVAVDGDFKLTPTLVFANKRGFGESCLGQQPVPDKIVSVQSLVLTLSRVFEGRMEVVYNLREHVGSLLVAILINKSYADAPLTHGEFLHGRWLVARNLLETDSERTDNAAAVCPNTVGYGRLYLHDMLLRDDFERSL